MRIGIMLPNQVIGLDPHPASGGGGGAVHVDIDPVFAPADAGGGRAAVPAP